MRLLTLILLFPWFLFSQKSLNPNANAFIDSLDLRINYFFVENTHPGSIAFIRKEDIKYECIKADYYRSTDVYWKDSNNKYWKKSFYNCSEKSPIETDSTILSFIEFNFETIKKEEVLKYQTKKDSIVQGVIRGSYKIRLHQPTKNYVFRLNSEIISKKFKTYHLATEGDNLNFEYNQNLKLVELNRLIEKFNSR